MDGQDTIMSLSNVSWEAEFRKLFEVGSDRYQQGKREVSSFFQPEELEFLQRIGYRAQEMFDFLEDHVNYGAPDYATAYKVAVLRERYFREVQGGVGQARWWRLLNCQPRPIPWMESPGFHD